MELGMPETQNINKTFFEKYQRFKPDLKIDYTYYYHRGTVDKHFWGL